MDSKELITVAPGDSEEKLFRCCGPRGVGSRESGTLLGNSPHHSQGNGVLPCPGVSSAWPLTATNPLPSHLGRWTSMQSAPGISVHRVLTLSGVSRGFPFAKDVSLCTPADHPVAGHDGQIGRVGSSSPITVITNVAYLTRNVLCFVISEVSEKETTEEEER